MIRVAVLTVILASFAIATIGCSGDSNNLVQASGKVTVGGVPAEGATILFHPDSPTIQTASGTVGAEGSFTLSSGTEAGIAVGKYQVTVIWPDASKAPTEQQKMMGTAEDGPDLLKGKYASKGVSTLTAEITSNTTTIPAFEL